MEFHVYYRGWPHKNLHQFAVQSETAGAAILEVAKHLKAENEMHFKPLLAMVVGGKL